MTEGLIWCTEAPKLAGYASRETVDNSSETAQPGTGLLSGLANKLQERLWATIEALSQSQAQRLAAIVESSDDAIVSVDLDGNIATWNGGAQRLFGYSPGDVIGRPVSLLIPPERQSEGAHLLDRIRRGDRTDHLRTQRLRSDGSIVDVSLSVSPIKDSSGSLIGASKIARDITDHERALRSLARRMEEQAALYEFTDRLFRAASLDDIYNAALDAIIRALSCDRASILLFDDAHVMRFVAWRGLSDGYRKAVEGHSPWRPNSQQPEPIAIMDVDTAELEQTLRTTIKAENICALAFIPLTAKGKLIGKFMTYYATPHEFAPSEIELAVTIARQVGFSIERLQAEEARRLLLKESAHRVKNTLATVHAIAGQTLRRTRATNVHAFMARLRALGEAHDLLTSENWHEAPVAEVVGRALKPFGDRFSIKGPAISMPAQASLMLTMSLHELATNAAKYGALSSTSGSVSVVWKRTDRGTVLTWKETGGPPVVVPGRKGFGSQLIDQSFAGDRMSCFDYRPDGLVCALELGDGR